jgi:hypothetical protein
MRRWHVHAMYRINMALHSFMLPRAALWQPERP